MTNLTENETKMLRLIRLNSAGKKHIDMHRISLGLSINESLALQAINGLIEKKLVEYSKSTNSSPMIRLSKESSFKKLKGE